MGVSAFVLEDEQIRDVDDPDSEMGDQFPEHARRLEDLESEFCADAYEYDVRIETLIRGGEFPD